MRDAGITAAHRQLCWLLTRSADDALYVPADPFSRNDQSYWTYFTDLANRSLVTPAVWTALEDANLTASVPKPYQDYFHAAFDWNAARNRSIQNELEHVISALNERSIVPVLLKGAAYIMDRTYCKPGDRILGDADILVDAGDSDAAVQVLRRLGYASAGWPGRSYDDHHHVEPLKNPNCQAYVEIHREALADPFAAVLPAGRIISDAQMLTANGATFAVPSPTHAATISFLHSEIIDGCDALARINIRSLMDMVRLNRRYDDSIDWGGMLDTMTSHKLANPLRNYLFSLQNLAGLEFADQPPVSIRQKMHFRLVDMSLRVRWLEKLMTIFDELSELRLRERYILEATGESVHSLRVRHVVFILKKAFSRTTDHAA